MSKIIILVLAAIGMSSCMQGTIKVKQACSLKTFVTIPAGLPVPSGRIEGNTTHDMAGPISEIGKFGDTKIDLLSVSFTSTEGVDLSFIRNLQIDFIRTDGSFERLANADSVGSTNRITFKTFPASNGFSDAMENGPVKFNISGEAISPSVSVTPVFEVCVKLTTNVDGTIVDIK